MKTYRRINSTYRASFTVEAAIVVPIVTVVIFFILYMSFYLHDRAKIQATLHEIITDGTLLIQYGINPDGYVTNEEREILYHYFDDKESEIEVIEKLIQEAFEKKLFIANIDDVSITNNIGELIILGNLVYETPISGFMSSFSKQSISIPIKIKGTIFKREEITRVADVVLNTGENIKGVKAAIDKLAQLRNIIK